MVRRSQECREASLVETFRFANLSERRNSIRAVTLSRCNYVTLAAPAVGEGAAAELIDRGALASDHQKEGNRSSTLQTTYSLHGRCVLLRDQQLVPA
ncbi:hypothetical protein EMEDMD4_1310005 [Sinorhizobium medicae]|uniref:Uncharacterized protein n=1 Tax=Sinorhizobium medicae TaxID=110321 RepID=A0A508WWH9_9HYPH|nr:hypothetical protein EMEDMD4_1310005 [Sinorhizobium medicae]